jgi:hypothetical protein
MSDLQSHQHFERLLARWTVGRLDPVTMERGQDHNTEDEARNEH